MTNTTRNPKRRQRPTRPKQTILGSIDSVGRSPGLPDVDDGRIIDAVLTIRRALRGGTRDTIRAVQQEIAYLRREARRALRRAAS